MKKIINILIIAVLFLAFPWVVSARGGGGGGHMGGYHEGWAVHILPHEENSGFSSVQR